MYQDLFFNFIKNLVYTFLFVENYLENSAFATPTSISLVQAWYQSWSSIEFKDLVAQVSLDGVYQYINYDLNDSVHLKMDGLLRRWKLLALKYKRESHVIHDQITEILISMSKSDIQKLNLGELNIKEN